MPHLRPSVAAIVLVLAACGGGEGATTPPLLADDAPSFSQLQAAVLTPSCTSCHAGKSPDGGLSLAADVAYENLVGVMPTNANAAADGLKRVIPGKPDSSLLYHKLVFPAGHHAHDYGNPMPTGTAGLSTGQLEFVRQWIAAGASRTAVAASPALLADRTPQTTQPFAPLAAPAAGMGYQVKVDEFTVAANFERELFQYRKVGNTADVFVSRIETSMRPFSHHLVLYTFDPKTPTSVMPSPDVMRDIRNADGSMNLANMAVMGYHVFFAGSMQSRSDFTFPAGTALRVPANSAVDLNVHYANHTTGPVQGEAYVNFHTVPASQVVHPLSTLNLQNTTLMLPAGQVTVVTKDFVFGAPTTIVGLTSHMHARGTKFQIRIVGGARDGELVYESTDWEHPALVNYATPIALAAGQGLRSTVTYNNTTNRLITFGLTSDQEMDIIFGYYY